jgi:hypothetical protein
LRTKPEDKRTEHLPIRAKSDAMMNLVPLRILRDHAAEEASSRYRHNSPTTRWRAPSTPSSVPTSWSSTQDWLADYRPGFAALGSMLAPTYADAAVAIFRSQPAPSECPPVRLEINR